MSEIQAGMLALIINGPFGENLGRAVTVIISLVSTPVRQASRCRTAGLSFLHEIRL